jgi:hypothetical protein
LNLLKVFQNPRNWPWTAFKSDGRCAASFSKENCLLETYFAGLKTSKFGPRWFSTAIGATVRNLSSNRSKGYEFASFDKLSAIQKILAVNS